MIRDRLLVAALPCVLVVPTVSADLPLTIEELLTAERRWRADVNLVYANSDRRDIDSRFGAIQVGPGQFITIPVSVGQARQNTDFLALSIGARYGMRLNTELYGRVSALSQDTRTLDADGAMSDSEQQFADAWMGINHRFSGDNDTPALLGFFELALVENTAGQGSNLAYGRTAMAGITTYRAIDPLVLSLTAGYRYSLERRVEGLDIDPGDLLFINPNIAFAVNHEITLTGGLQWRWQERDRLSNQEQGIRTTRTQMEFGLGYAWSKRLTLLATSRADVTGDSGVETGVTFLYKFPGRFSKNHEHEGGDADTNR